MICDCAPISLEDLEIPCDSFHPIVNKLEINTETKEITINGELRGYVPKDYDGGNVMDCKDLNGRDCAIFINVID